MDVEKVIEHFGGVSATARACKIKQPAVSRWRRRGIIPWLRQLQIERVTKSKLKADKEDKERE